MNVLSRLLLALAVIILTARAVGRAFRLIRQPAVMGEVVTGIMLGPSFLGWIAPGAMAFLLPASVVTQLEFIAQFGVILFIFLVGVELDTGLLRRQIGTATAVSLTGIVAPFALGIGAAWWLYPLLAPEHVSFVHFALFFGVSLSVTAFPVLARIITDRGLHGSYLGSIALTCAAMGDFAAWCILSFITGLVLAKPGGAFQTVLMTLLYILCMFVVMGPLARWFTRRVDRAGRMSRGSMAVACVAFLLSASLTEYIGIHALFGAFFLGVVIPHDSLLARELKVKIHDLVVVLFLPAFFAFTGLRLRVGLLSSVDDWLICGIIIILASAGKFGGVSLAAMLAGVGRRDAAALGILMNTRGLFELVVLNLGLDMGIISPRLFAMLVIMALVTTFATAPVLAALTRPTGKA